MRKPSKQRSKYYKPDHVHGEIPLVNIGYKISSIVISFTFPSFVLDDEDKCLPNQGYKHVYIEGAGFFTDGGRKPLLPSFGVFVNIPHNCICESWEYSVLNASNKYEEAKMDKVVLPALEYFKDVDIGQSVIDEEAYKKNDWTPKKFVEVSGPMNIDGYRSLLVHVRPVRYHPKKNILKGYYKFKVILNLKEKSNGRIITPSVSREAFGNLFLNPEMNVGRWLEIENLAPQRAEKKGAEFLIIFAPGLNEAAEYLARWKRKKGIETKMVLMGKDIPLTNTLQGKIKAIKNYIRNERQTSSSLRYVLLFGDVDSIPPEKLEGTFGGIHDHITDFYYSTERDPTPLEECPEALEDDYSTENDPTPLEECPEPLKDDGCQIKEFSYITGKDPKVKMKMEFPSLAIGRIPTSDKKEAQKIVETIEKYEKDPPPDDSRYYSIPFASCVQLGRRYLDTVEKICLSLKDRYSIEKVYSPRSEHPKLVDLQNYIIKDANKAADKLVEKVSEGRAVIGYRGHGTWKGWSDPPLEIGDLERVDPKHPSIFFSINCSTGEFGLNDSKDCFSEFVLKRGIAASVIAATCESNTWHNNLLIRALYDALLGTVLPTFNKKQSHPLIKPRLGDLLNYARSYLLTKKSMPDFNLLRHQLEIYHIIGDPTIEIWKKAPKEMEIGAEIKGDSLEITLSQIREDCVLTLWHEDDWVANLETNLDKFLKFPLNDILKPGHEKSKLKVCFWASGYRFKEVPVPFEQADPEVV